MADIKGLSIFNNTNNGMKAIKDAKGQKSSLPPSPTPSEEKKEHEVQRVTIPKEKTKSRAKRSVGAPIKNYDRTHASKQPIKLSTILNSTSRSMVEKYETSLNKDELLRKALDFYIKQNLTKEDKIDLLRDVTRDLDIFREKNPTIEIVDEEGNVIKTAKQIEDETESDLRKRWGIDN
ncbi:hypothetical protein ACFFH2_10325 [Enterococcus devriesei]|uniref:Uncharacterized protein n=1 Tax=Enterococcus devriesei TaxID=319970 RepID=A0A1L8ST08_9ENTE|nr:hypothetical protein [Enterococcus devriesei]MDN6545651.1 hypothetical protein [Enterococcaceae bacterium]OJG34992.1 hypothetical protein RV00_GL000542 [Enterococcus devriesei]